MDSPHNTNSPTIEIIGTAAEPSDAAVSALARLLLSVADRQARDPDDPNEKTAASPQS